MMSQNENEQFDPKKLIWEKGFGKIRFWTILSFVLIAALFILLVALCPVYGEWMQEKKYMFVGILFPLMLLMALAGVLMVTVSKKENKLNTNRYILLANAVVAIVSFMAVKNAIGGHATTYEEKAYWIFLVNMIVQIVVGLVDFKIYREIKIASQGENSNQIQ